MNHVSSRLASVSILVAMLAGCHGGHASSSTTQPTIMSANSVPPVDLAIEADAKKTLTYLSSDELEGRGVGTHGIDLAADYIAHRYESLGLKKVPGQSTYFQPFDYPLGATVGAATALSINGKPLEQGKSFVPIPASTSAKFEGDVVFVGYGISDPENFHYDDYQGLDVKGKVVLAMQLEPMTPDGNSRFTGGDWSPGATFAAKAAVAAEHGAAGLLIVNPPGETPTTAPSTMTATTTSATTRSARRAPTRGQLRIAAMSGKNELINFSMMSNGSTLPAKLPVVQITIEAANAMLSNSGLPTLRDLQKQIDGAKKPASTVLEKSHITGEVAIDHRVAKIKNVMAVLPGKGPHADEYVIVGAHYDHLGCGMLGSLAPGSHEIHHGADDNGSGTTAVLELATKMVHQGPQPRSILFMNYTAEEEGLIGSDYFVKHPTISLDKIVAMLNLDMVGRLSNESIYIGGSGTAQSFLKMLQTGDEESPLKILYTGPEMGRGGMGPSDHETFAKKKIPVLFFFTGLHRDYHTPTDTVEKINFDGMGQIISLAEYCIHHMLTMEHEPYIAKYDQQPGLRQLRNGATLGVTPDANSVDDMQGVKVGGVRERSAAAAAGVLENDTIVQLNNTKINSIYDLTDFLREATPGDPLTIVVNRASRKIELHGTMGGNRPASRPATTRSANTRMSATAP